MTQALAYDPLAPEVIADPYPWYRRLRDEAPAYYDPGRDFWAISRYDDVLAGARAHGALSSAEGVMYARVPLPMMLTMDPPDHTRLRRLVARDFTPRAINAWGPMVDRLVEETVAPMVGQPSVDYMDALAFPLPINVIAEVLGIPPADRAQFKEWSDGIVEGFNLNPTSDRAMLDTIAHALTSLNAYLTGLIEERRRCPGPDLVSRMVDPGQSDRVTDLELFWFCLLLLVAGNETTTNLLGNMALAFVEHPDQWRLLQSRPDLIPSAVEETLRYDAPIQGFFRTALEPYAVAGTEIPTDARVFLLFGAANRDPNHYERADEFLVERNPTDHLAFGNGVHLCLGAHLARMEGAAVLRALLRHTQDFELTGDPVRGTNPNLRGVVTLPLTFVAR